MKPYTEVGWYMVNCYGESITHRRPSNAPGLSQVFRLGAKLSYAEPAVLYGVGGDGSARR